MTRYHLVCQAFAFLGLLAACGCGGDPRASVSGKVTYKDKALPGGMVMFVSEDDTRHDQAQIQPDGSYNSTNVPIGKVRVAVHPAAKGVAANMPKGVKKPNLPSDGSAPKSYGASEGEYVDIPKHLRDPSTSKITYEVKSGTQTIDIPLKDK